jgi:hypothetical protein
MPISAFGTSVKGVRVLEEVATGQKAFQLAFILVGEPGPAVRRPQPEHDLGDVHDRGLERHNRLRPRETQACFSSAAIRSSAYGVIAVSANDTGHIVPSSRFA